MASIRDFQELMRRMYFHRDSVRGRFVNMLWLVSEVGEFADALVKGEEASLGVEAADVFAWLCSECNVLGIDLEEAAMRRYGSGCPRCGSSPCTCDW